MLKARSTISNSRMRAFGTNARLFSSCTSVLRNNRASLRKIPGPTEKIPSVEAFLATIGRKCDEHVEVYENKWENLFSWDSAILKEKGIPAQQRKYILSQVERLRKDETVAEIKVGKKSFLGGERKRKETVAKMRAEQRAEQRAASSTPQ
ncbi:LAME_0H01530g1_1 [Lachancea meyersii CBS 8951]|uniref:Small ribosomal subunit protein mS41 n=1 Tax=Lachancea meyersii CBS 8951 TaxID=1266667 RepID=A0A1G4KD84_9SACH|nr:LAME_0H01530g1_1 [Lachancea meyersii CBS 8951]